MALKRQYEMSSLFSMASMTDIIFLLLIFFMVSSTYVFPTALELNLPQSSEQTAIKPQVYVHVLPEGVIIAQLSDDDNSLTNLDLASLESYLETQKGNVAEGEQFVVSVRADVCALRRYRRHPRHRRPPRHQDGARHQGSRLPCPG